MPTYPSSDGFDVDTQLTPHVAAWCEVIGPTLNTRATKTHQVAQMEYSHAQVSARVLWIQHNPMGVGIALLNDC